MMQVESAIFVAEETCAAVIPALHYMHGNTGEHDAGASGHEDSTNVRAPPLTEIVVCP
jgi:hypothetical protein